MAARLTEDSDQVLYLYGITQRAVTPVKVVGVDGSARVEAVSCAGLLCYISRVSREEFADKLAQNMENLDWLASASVRHQRVVGAIAEVESVLPARFGTVFLTEDSLVAHVKARKAALQADFGRIEDADEWGVKVFAIPRKVEMPRSAAGSGKDYLKAKATLLRARPTNRPQPPDPELNDFARQLDGLAAAKAESGKISGGQRGLEWQASFLLRRSDRRKFESLLKRYSKLWSETRRIEATGPWPPYSFVSTRNE